MTASLDLPRVCGRHRNRALAALRRERAVRLRTSGMTYQAIADEMGYSSKGTVYNVVKQAMCEHVTDAVAERRQLEGARLDALQAGLWERAMAGDVAAAMECRNIILARIKLFGLELDRERSKPPTVVIEPTVENVEAFITAYERGELR